MCTRSGFQSKTDQGWSLVRPVHGRNARQLKHLLVEQMAVVGQDRRDTGIEPGALLLAPQSPEPAKSKGRAFRPGGFGQSLRAMLSSNRPLVEVVPIENLAHHCVEIVRQMSTFQ